MRWLKRNRRPSAPAQRRERPPPRWARLARRGARWGGIALVAGGVPVALWQTGLGDAARGFAWRRTVAASAGAGLVVREVLAEGRRETTRAELLAALGVKGGQPILDFDPEAARLRVEALPWVRAATVERRLPDVVRVRVLERRALAWWQKDGKLVLIDHSGETIRAAAPSRFQELIVVVGDDAPGYAAELIAMLKREPDLAGRVRAAVRVGQRRWNVKLDGGIDVRLPEENAAAAWAKLGDLERKHSILSRDVEAVDLRLPDRLIVQTKSGRIPIPQPGGRNT